MCTRGQTLDDAIFVQTYSPVFDFTRHAFINIGLTDIRNGISLTDFQVKYRKLVNLCGRNGYFAIVSTIVPLVEADEELIRPFNDFIWKRFKNGVELVGNEPLESALRSLIPE